MDRDFMLHYDIHFYAIFLLVILILVILRNNGKTNTKIKLFLALIYLTISIILLEVASEVSNGVQGTFAYIIHYSSSYLLALFATLIGSVWACYVDYTIFESHDSLKSKHYYLHVPAFTSSLLLINIFVPILFSIDQNNVLSKGPLQILILAALGILYFYMYVKVKKNKSRLKSSVVWGILLIVLFPTIFEVIEYIIGDLPYTFVSVAFSIIFVYLFTESVSNTRDKATDLFTRQKAVEHINTSLRRNDPFSVIVIDLDHFKEINDKMGHVVGDQAILEFTKRVSSLFRFDSLVARMGGDEFIVISSIVDYGVLTERLEHIDQKLSANESEYSKCMRFSYGCVLSSEIQCKTADDIIHAADLKMYECKAKKKLA